MAKASSIVAAWRDWKPEDWALLWQALISIDLCGELVWGADLFAFYNLASNLANHEIVFNDPRSPNTDHRSPISFQHQLLRSSERN